MKRFLLPLFFLLLVAIPAVAQDTGTRITLDDATPRIDVVISLPPDSTGAVALNIAQAAVTLTDAANTVVFHAADARLHGVELNIAPNSGSHTLTVERLPGMTEAYVSVVSLPDLTLKGNVKEIEGSTVTLNQEIALALDASNPGGTVAVNIPAGTTGAMRASFTGSYATTQLVDAAGIVLVESTGGHVDGMNLVLDGDDYQFTLLGSGLTAPVVAEVRVVSAVEGGFTVLNNPVPAEAVAIATTAPAECSATVIASSADLNSGPGTGYTVVASGYHSQVFKAGGRNPENNWLVVRTDTGSAWIASNDVQLQGACDNLTVFDIPLRDAQLSSPVVTVPQQPGLYQEEHEHDENEHDD